MADSEMLSSQRHGYWVWIGPLPRASFIGKGTLDGGGGSVPVCEAGRLVPRDGDDAAATVREPNWLDVLIIYPVNVPSPT